MSNEHDSIENNTPTLNNDSLLHSSTQAEPAQPARLLARDLDGTSASILGGLILTLIAFLVVILGGERQTIVSCCRASKTRMISTCAVTILLIVGLLVWYYRAGPVVVFLAAKVGNPFVQEYSLPGYLLLVLLVLAAMSVWRAVPWVWWQTTTKAPRLWQTVHEFCFPRPQPIAVSGWNAKVVTSADGAHRQVETFDNRARAWYERGAIDDGGTPHHDGLPSGRFKGAYTKAEYEFQPFLEPHVLRLTKTQLQGTLIFAKPRPYREIAVLAASGDAHNAEYGTMIIHFTDGTSHECSYRAYDWDAAARPTAVHMMGRNGNIGDGSGFTFELAARRFGLFETRISLGQDKLQSKMVVSLTFDLAKGATISGIFAISGIRTRTIRKAAKSIAEATPRDRLQNAPADSTSEVFKRLAGRWHLEYYRGDNPHSETLSIDKDANYYIDRHPDQVRFVLQNVTYDPKERKILWTKVPPPGTARRKPQTEALQISEDFSEMLGHAQHDGHRLKYRRRSG